MNLKSKVFGSLIELNTWIKETAPCGCFESSVCHSMRASSEWAKFSGTKTFDEADTLMLGGWKSGAKNLRAAIVEQQRGGVQVRNEVHYYGSRPNVAAYLQGAPKTMWRRVNKLTAPKVVNIVYNAAVGCKVKVKDTPPVAAKLLNVIAGIEKSGMRVNLYIASFAQIEGEYMAVLVNVKKSTETANIELLAYPLMHGSFERRHTFAVTERIGLQNEAWPKNYGAICSKEDTSKIIQELNIDGAYFDYYKLRHMEESEIIKECMA